ncbi:hypothetical protein [Acinetobacter stercoris]|uniref:Uncharacterized protein n=1 Tax=Acinetobacter stercoris TaxID=2126983 RepID=A0A2U3N326_9GAMM|nr:hypothetical protein [Acinetobacter stercoris]SPL72015.1 hypothetical protein KPC_3193 [Acinetobacter stercoris]
MIKQLKPVKLPKDLCNWSHPDMQLVDPLWNCNEERGYTEQESELFKNNGGIEIKIESYWYEDIPEIPEEDSSDWSNWKPEPPSPEYFLIGAYDTEDGPALWWAKEKVED